MAAVVGWVGQSAVDGVLKTVASYLEGQVKRGSNIERALKELDAVLTPIQFVLGRAEKVELNLEASPQLGKWIWQLRDAVEEAEDVLDDMEYDKLERQILERDSSKEGRKPAATSGLLDTFRKVQAPCSSKFMKIGMDDMLNDAVVNLRLVSEKIDLLNDIIKTSPSRGGGYNNSTGPLTEEDEVIGRDNEKKMVLELMKESGADSQESHKISALTISGMGGLGKTTLARSIYNDNNLSFEVKMWVTVSNNNVEMEVLMRKAIECATKKPPTTTDLPGLQEELKVAVASKKCLLILDDVWEDQSNQNPQQWENFIIVLSKHAKTGSKILITSRTESIAQIVLQLLLIEKKSFPLKFLEDKESSALFFKHAFFGVDDNKQNVLKQSGDQIAKKCGGLPLALKIIGALLRTKPEPQFWVSVLENNNINLIENNNIMKVLKLSYQCLPSNLQSCFRICSLFPQDYKFGKDELITLWMGLGCIDQGIDQNTQPEDIGKSYLDILVSRSFFVYDYEVEFYTMHDLLHDLARDVSKYECLRVEGNETVELPKTLRHLFVDGQLKSNLMGKISNLKRLRTLALNYNCEAYFKGTDFPDYTELDDIVNQLTSLHALFVSSRTMPNLSVIRRLKHLRLFHMKVSILNKSLEPLYNLYHLQNLKCVEESHVPHDSNAQFECDGIGNHVKLRHLFLPDVVFGQITQLGHLIELQKVELRLKENNMLKLSYLKDLNKLRHLIIKNEREITRIDEALEEANKANLVDKKHLETLCLNWIKCDPHHHEKIYNCLQLMKGSKIKNLEVVNYSGMIAPRWMTSDYLPCVTHLKLHGCDNLERLPPLGQLQSLKFLSLVKCAGVKQSGNEFFGSDDNGGFPSLEELGIENMENWVEWTIAENRSWFPCLKKLYINDCDRLKALPALPFSLKELHLFSVGLVALPPWHEVSTSHSHNSVLEKLEIYGCPNLKNFQLMLSKCIHLEKLSIKNCESLRELSALPLSLKKLKLEGVGLIALPAWHEDDVRPPSLEHLKISFCRELVYIQPFYKKCVFLKKMSIEACQKVLASDEFNINQVNSSTSLQKLSISGFEKLISLDGLQALTSLKKLRIRNCNSLIASSSTAATESFDQTHSLFSLDIDNTLLLQIEPLRSMNSVKELWVSNDKNASCLPRQWLLQNHTSLTKLRVEFCLQLGSLPDEMPSSLKILEIAACPKLKVLPDKMPSSLESLKISRCELLESLPNKMPSSVESLDIFSCELLKSLPDEMPSSLRSLQLWNCGLLESLPNKMLSSLESLTISLCPLLWKRYREDGGPDWPRIAHIPSKYIWKY